MARKLIEIGTRFGSLVVFEQAEDQVYGKQRHTAHKCQCDCGNVVVRAATFRDGQKTCKKCHGGKFKDDGSQRKLLEIGARFGRLVVLKRAENGRRGSTAYKCQCDCGNTITIRATQLRRGQQSCKKCISFGKSRRKLIPIGTRFGRLVVVGQAEDIGKLKTTAYKCKCDCGNTIIVKASSLRRGQRFCRNCSCKLPKGEAGFNALFKRYKHDAKDRGYVFELAEDEFRKLVTSHCAYCGTLPYSIHRVNHAYYGGAGAHGDFVYNGVDRMNSDLGYTSDNVVSCCKRCNWAKRDMSYDEFMDWLDQVAEFRPTLNFLMPLDKRVNLA